MYWLLRFRRGGAHDRKSRSNMRDLHSPQNFTRPGGPTHPIAIGDFLRALFTSRKSIDIDCGPVEAEGQVSRTDSTRFITRTFLD